MEPLPLWQPCPGPSSLPERVQSLCRPLRQPHGPSRFEQPAPAVLPADRLLSLHAGLRLSRAGASPTDPGSVGGLQALVLPGNVALRLQATAVPPPGGRPSGGERLYFGGFRLNFGFPTWHPLCFWASAKPPKGAAAPPGSRTKTFRKESPCPSARPPSPPCSPPSSPSPRRRLLAPPAPISGCG